MEKKCKIEKLSEIIALKEFDENKDIEIFSDFVYQQTIKLDEEKVLTYSGNIRKLYKDIKYLNRDYPNFRKWYFNKVVPNLMNGTREVLLCFIRCNKDSMDLKLAGLAILKKTEKEKKICTFRISEEYRGQEIAKELFEKSFEVLETRKPLITISEKRKKSFEKYIKMFDFECLEEKKGLYTEDIVEYVYNGRLD